MTHVDHVTLHVNTFNVTTNGCSASIIYAALSNSRTTTQIKIVVRTFIMHLLKSRATPPPVDIELDQWCPACGHAAVYLTQLGRYIHVDIDKDDTACFVAIMRGGDDLAGNLRDIQEDRLELQLWPLPIVAASLNVGVHELERRHREDIVENTVGLECLPGSVVLHLTAARKAKIEADAEKLRQEWPAKQAQRDERRRQREELAAEKRRRQTALDAESLAINAKLEQHKVWR